MQLKTNLFLCVFGAFFGFLISCTVEQEPPATSTQPATPQESEPLEETKTAQEQDKPQAADAEEGEPKQVRVQHILIAFKDAVGFKNRPGAPERSQAEAKELAADILAQVKADAGKFSQLMNQYSDDTGPGVYGMANHDVQPNENYYPRSGMAKAFGDVSFALKVGEIGMTEYHVQASPFGWHIIQRIE